MGGVGLLWSVMAALAAPVYGEPTVEARGWIPAGVDPATVPQCGRTTEVVLPPGWRRVDCRMGNQFLRNDRTGAEIRAHITGPRFTQPPEAMKRRLLTVLTIRERLGARQLGQNPGYPSIPLPDPDSVTYLTADGPASRRYAFCRDGQDYRGKLAARQDLKDDREWQNWLFVGRWPADQDAASLRDFGVIFDSMHCR
jgi:hypothetical protein